MVGFLVDGQRRWQIAIHGFGPHEDHLPEDAKKLLKKFAEELAAMGHVVYQVHFRLADGDHKRLAEDGTWHQQ